MNKLVYSPLTFYRHYILNEREDIDGRHMLDGRLFHCFAMAPHTFDEQFVVMQGKYPVDKAKVVIDAVYKRLVSEKKATGMEGVFPLSGMESACLQEMQAIGYYQQLKADKDRMGKICSFDNENYFQFLQRAEGKSVVDEDVIAGAQRAAMYLRSNDDLMQLLGQDALDADPTVKQVFTEVEMNLDDPNFPFVLRGIFDNLVIDHTKQIIYINDLKKTGKPAGDFNDNLHVFNYDIQAAVYTEIMRHHMKLQNMVGYELQFRFIVADSTGQIIPYRISKARMNDWRYRLAGLLKNLKHHINEQDFSAPVDVLINKEREL